MPDNVSAPGIFSRAWLLLSRNWIIIVPAVAIGFVTNFLVQFLAGSGDTSYGDMGGGGPAMFAAYLTSMIIVAIQIVGGVLSIAVTTGMARAAWDNGTTAIRDGLGCFAHHPLSGTAAMLLLMLLGFVAAALVVPTFFLSVAAFVVFFIYTMPAVFVGNRSATDAIVESCSIAAANLRTTVLVVLLIAAVAVVAGIAGHIASAVPLAGPILEAVLMYAAVAYGTLVVVGEYLQLRRA